jgi:hypothetical protein
MIKNSKLDKKRKEGRREEKLIIHSSACMLPKQLCLVTCAGKSRDSSYEPNRHNFSPNIACDSGEQLSFSSDIREIFLSG